MIHNKCSENYPACDNSIKMASTTQINLRPRPAHTSGPTYLSYTPNGTKLVTIGSNNTIRVYKTGSDGEPTNIDDCQEQNMAVDSTVGLQKICEEYHANFASRMNFSLQALKMELLANIPSIRWHSTSSLCAVRCQFETLRYPRMVDGVPWPVTN